jgi:hypothetical protein
MLRASKNTLADVYKRADGVCAAIATVLESDDDMNMMYLSSNKDERIDPTNEKKTFRRASIFVDHGAGEGSRLSSRRASCESAGSADEIRAPLPVEIEAILETYLQSISNVNHEVEQLKARLTYQEQTIELSLDLTRNSLLRVDMLFQIMGFAVRSVGCAVRSVGCAVRLVGCAVRSVGFAVH